MNYKGVLFDLDGVLIKSVEQHLEAWQHAFGHYKTTIEAREFYLLEGRGVKSVVEALTDKYGIDASLRQKIVDDKVKFYKSIFRPEFYDGIYSLLDMLKEKNIRMAVVTGAMRDRVNDLVREHLDGYFSAIISSDDVKNTKPYPEPYLKGASLLGLKAEECVVVENAPMGIKAAKKAGMVVIAITTTLRKEDLQEADYITESFNEVKKYLDEQVFSF